MRGLFLLISAAGADSNAIEKRAEGRLICWFLWGRRQQQEVVLAARHGFVKKTSCVQNRKWEGQTQGLTG